MAAFVLQGGGFSFWLREIALLSAVTSFSRH